MGLLGWLSGLAPSPDDVAHEIRGLRLRQIVERLHGRSGAHLPPAGNL